MIPRPSDLRFVLQGAIHAREAALRNGRSHRKDLARLWAGIGRAQAFLNSFPFADDERVRSWCSAHWEDVAMIVPGNTPRVLAKLIMEKLKGEISDPLTFPVVGPSTKTEKTAA